MVLSFDMLSFKFVTKVQNVFLLCTIKCQNMFPRNSLVARSGKNLHITKGISCQFYHVGYVKHKMNVFASITRMGKRTIIIIIIIIVKLFTVGVYT